MTRFEPARYAVSRRCSAAARVLAGGWVVLVLTLTLMPDYAEPTPVGKAATADAIRNVLLFAPLGLCLRAAGWPLRVILLVTFALSGAIETAQLLIPGRFPALRDVAMNTIGAGLGALGVAAALGEAFRSRRGAARLSLALGGAAALVLCAPGTLLRAAPPASAYFTALRPDFPHYARFQGEVLEASIGPERIETGFPTPQSRELRRLIREGAPIVVRARPTGRNLDLAPLLRINDGTWEVLMLGVHERDLLLRRHSRAGAMGLEEPIFRWPEALPEVADNPLRIEITPQATRWTATVDGRDVGDSGPTPAVVRRLIADGDRFSPELAAALDALALALLFGTIALFMRRRVESLGAAALVLLALTVGPAWLGLVPSPPSEWLGAGLGLVGGALCQRSLRPTPRRWRRAQGSDV